MIPFYLCYISLKYLYNSLVLLLLLLLILPTQFLLLLLLLFLYLVILLSILYYLLFHNFYIFHLHMYVFLLFLLFLFRTVNIRMYAIKSYGSSTGTIISILWPTCWTISIWIPTWKAVACWIICVSFYHTFSSCYSNGFYLITSIKHSILSLLLYVK